MTLPDCAACGARVRSDIDDTRGQVEVCTGCGTSQAARPVFAGIRQAVREVRARTRREGLPPMRCPSCKWGRCDKCHASGCECPHDRHPRSAS